MTLVQPQRMARATASSQLPWSRWKQIFALERFAASTMDGAMNSASSLMNRRLYICTMMQASASSAALNTPRAVSPL